MKTISALFVLISLLCIKSRAQTNMISTSILAEQVMMGNYNPNSYMPSVVINDHHQIICEINDGVMPDSLKSHLENLGSFYTRNSGSDTLSPDTGIGAARRWVFSKFQEISAANENRLIPSYLQFDQAICGEPQHRNVFAVLPGADTTDKSIVIYEAHMDTRCETNCNDTCEAQGIDDNGSGTALVIELARVMSRYSFNHTMVFMATIAEEQGLLGANAFAQYAVDNGIAIKAVQNNDVVGGIICGATSSPPSCPGLNDIDSTQLRIFSHGAISGTSRGYAKAVKIYYLEKLLSIVDVPMTISIINQEDRTGRGGDHIPFRQQGFTAIRFTAANEHGNGAGIPPDRHHTSGDILGVDTNNDQVIDSFYVDFNYLARNAVINGAAGTLVALGPQAPGFTVTDDPTGLIVEITPPLLYQEYRVGIRKISSVEYDSIYRFDGTPFLVPGQTAGANYYLGVAAIDNKGIMSPFSKENSMYQSDATTAPAPPDALDYNIDCNAIGVEEQITISKERISIHPNPTMGEFRVSGFEFGVEKIQVYDLFGRLVFSTTEPDVDMSGFPGGIYFVRIGEVARKVILQ